MHTPSRKEIDFSANYVLSNILEKLRLFHDSSQEEVDGLVPIRPARDSHTKVA